MDPFFPSWFFLLICFLSLGSTNERLLLAFPRPRDTGSRVIGCGSPHATAGLHICIDKHRADLLNTCTALSLIASHLNILANSRATWHRSTRNFNQRLRTDSQHHLHHVGSIFTFQASFNYICFHCKSRKTLACRVFFLTEGHPSVFEVYLLATRCGMLFLMRIAQQASHLFVVEVLRLIKSRRVSGGTALMF